MNSIWYIPKFSAFIILTKKSISFSLSQDLNILFDTCLWLIISIKLLLKYLKEMILVGYCLIKCDVDETQVSGKWRRCKTNDRRAKIEEWYRGKREILIASIKLIARLIQNGSRLLCRAGGEYSPPTTFIFCQYASGPRVGTDISYSALIAVAYDYSCLNSRYVMQSIFCIFACRLLYRFN